MAISVFYSIKGNVVYRQIRFYTWGILISFASLSFAQQQPKVMPGKRDTSQKQLATATFGAGCFWCVEAVFEQLKGVHEVKAGYAGGHVDNPTYRQVCSGTTGHAEVAQLKYDPDTISYKELLEVFWKTHDPTTKDRQGNDVGEQYRSVVFYHNDEQKRMAERYKQRLNESAAFEQPVVTEISPCENFYEAEADHQDYYSSNPDKPYCSFVIRPKLEKLERAFKDKLK